MKLSYSAGFCSLILATLVLAQTPKPPASYFEASDIVQALEESAAERPSMAVANISNSDVYRINLIRRTEAAGAIVHEIGTELHYITEGVGTLVTGGILDRPAGGGRATISGGLSRRVSAGDAVLIPEGTPHWYSSVETSVTYLEVRF